MRKILIGFIIVIMIGILACSSSQESAAGESEVSSGSQAGSKTAGAIEWMRFDDGLNAAAAENKHLIAYFWRDGCPWCTRMEKDTFADAGIIDVVTEGFIAAKVKTTNNETFNTPFGELTTGQLARSLQIRGVPAVFFFDMEGNPVFSVPGYVPADMYQTILRYVSEKHYMNKSFQEFQDTESATS